MRSPVLLLEKAIAGAAFQIAPERAAELKTLDEAHQFVLVFTDEKNFSIRIKTQTHEAMLPVAALEYLWCASHLLHVLYRQYVATQQANEPQLDLSKAPQCAQAIDLLNWSMNNMKHSGVQPWPTGMPVPHADPERKSDIHIANELFLCAAGWLIHHEISHVVLGHQPVYKVFSQQKEQEADLRATEWIMSSSQIEAERQKRSLGIVAALLSLQFLDDPREINEYVRSHPPTVQRLDYCLNKAGALDDSGACALATVGLQFHLSQFEIGAPLDGASIRDVLGEFMVAFTTHNRSQDESEAPA
jgi:hypothetical protein